MNVNESECGEGTATCAHSETHRRDEEARAQEAELRYDVFLAT